MQGGRRGPDRSASRGQLSETMERARLAILLPALVALAVVPPFLTTNQAGTVVAIFACLGTLALLATAAAVGFSRRTLSVRAVRFGKVVAVVLALATGLAWASLPALVFSATDAEHRPLLLAAIFGSPLGVFLIGPIEAASLAFLAPLVLGGMIGLIRTAQPIAFVLAGLLLVYVWVIFLGWRFAYATSAERLSDHARVGEQSDIIDLLLDDTAEAAGDWLWQTDERLRLRDVSDRLSAALGCSAKALTGKPIVTLFARDGAGTPIAAAFAAGKPFHKEIVEARADGRTVWWRVSGKPVHDARGDLVGFRGVGSDVTALREAELRIAHLATHDALTGLANRETFQVEAARACAEAASDGRTRALLLLDLDGFKGVNDSLGHAAGDEMLSAVAAKLRDCAPKGTLVARLGGDEFAILCAPSMGSSAESLAKTIVRAVGTIVADGETKTRIGVSIGIALVPDHASEPGALSRRADIALYRAKAAGRGCHVLFDDAFERALAEQHQLEHDIGKALERDEFVLYYQPLLDIADGSIGTCEALIRWQSPTRGFVPPGAFIPAAEAGGLIVAIGRFVLNRACRDAAGWPVPARVAVNISPDHLRSPGFVGDVVAALRAAGLPASRLEVEITEGVFLDKSAAAIDALNQLRERGITIALDDFGTGFSSLNYLIDFPVDKIKIDRSFVTRLVDGHQSRAIVDAMMMLARRLDIRVTAEGVETLDQALALKLRRCDDLQGYLISKPQPADQIARLLVTLPSRLRTEVPTLMDSPLAAALAMKRKSA